MVKPSTSKTFYFLHSHLFLAYTLIRFSFASSPLYLRTKVGASPIFVYTQ